MQQKQSELDQLKKEHDEESRRALSLGIKLDDALSRAQRAEAGAAKLRTVEGQLAALEKQNEKLTADLEVLTSQASSSTTRIKSLQKAAEDCEFKVASARREANTLHNSVAAAQEESRKAMDKLEKSRAEILALKKELGSARAASLQSATQRQAAEAHSAHLELVLQNREEQVTSLKNTIRSLQDELNNSDSISKTMQVSLTAYKQQCKVAEEQAQSMCRSLTLASENQRAAERASQSLQERLAAAQTASREKDAKISQMKYLIDEAEDRYQALLTRGMEETEGLARLNMQLAQSKAIAHAAQEDLEKARSDYASSLEDARLAARAAEQHAAESKARGAEARRAQASYLEGLIQRVDKSLDSVSSLQAEAGRILGDLCETQERSMHVLTSRLQKMETQWAGVEDLVAVIDTTMGTLSAVLGKQEFRTVSAAEEAQSKVIMLEGLLSSERAARTSLIEEKQQAEASHRTAIEMLQRTADERLESERQRLNLRLSSVQGEVMQLKAACEADHAEALRLLELERKQMDKLVDAARAEVAYKDAKIAEMVQELRSAGDQALGTLSARHTEEFERLENLHSKEVANYQARLKAIQVNVRSAWGIGQLLFQDMLSLAKHLFKMGWDVKQLDKGTIPPKDAEDGTGAELAKASSLLRLHFSHLTEAVQDFARKAQQTPSLPPPTPQGQTADWKTLAKELRTTVQKLVHVEDALASNCTCMLCLEVLKHPITCVPGGHTYCKACFEDKNYECEECGKQVTQTVRNTALEAICSKFEFKQQALLAIQKAINKASSE